MPYRRLAASAAIVLALLWADGTHAQANGDDPATREYFVRQGPGEHLLVRINPFEAAFESVVITRDGERLALAAVRDNRLAPVFHLVPDAGHERLLDIRVSLYDASARAKFDIELSRLSEHDERSARLVRAYRYLAFGLEPLAGETTANWSVKINSLLGAADAFEGFGMEEMRSWCLYYAARFAYAGLADHHTALDFTDQVLAGAGQPRSRRLELAAVLLEAEVLSALRLAGEALPPDAEPDPVQSRLERAIHLAGALDQQLERAHGLYASGRDWQHRGRTEAALERLGTALAIADAIGAVSLAGRIREDMVAIHEQRGDVLAYGEVLDDIGTRLDAAGAGEALAENLLAQGRLFNRTYRYAAAAAMLEQALELENNSVTRAQVRLALARARYESGDFDRALELARLAVLNPRTGAIRRPNPLIDVAEGLDILAGVYRARGDFERLDPVRQAQPDHRDGLAADSSWHYQRGLDALAAGQSARAREWFERSRRSAGGTAHAPWRDLGLLRTCNLGGAALDCGEDAVRDAHRRLLGLGLPRAALEAQVLLAGWALDRDQPGLAARLLDQALEDMRFFQATLPGVLGAWYSRQGETVFGTRLVVAARLSGGPSDGLASLLALSRARQVEALASRAAPAGEAGGAPAMDELRVLLSRQDPGLGGSVDTGRAGQIDERLAAARAAFSAVSPALTRQGLQARLDGLAEDEALLTFHLGEPGGQLLLVRASGVWRTPLAQASALARELDTARAQWPVLGGAAFDRLATRLGERLLGPVAPRLPAKLVFLPAGASLGLPLDALKLDGRHLAEMHQVTQRLTLPPPAPVNAPRSLTAQARTFLAADPSDWSGEYLQALRFSPVPAAVREIWVGPGLTVVQGGALLADEFEGPAYRQADLIHLAMPGVMDLGRPAESHLELSEAGRGRGRTRLAAERLFATPVQARVAVLSGTRWTGQPASAFATRLPLVHELLEAGADAVLASGWAARDEAAIRQWVSVHEALKAGRPPAKALAAAKRRVIRTDGEGESRDWARLQVYTR